MIFHLGISENCLAFFFLAKLDWLALDSILHLMIVSIITYCEIMFLIRARLKSNREKLGYFCL